MDGGADTPESEGFFYAPMSYLTKKFYKDKLLDPRWQRKRLEVLNRENWTCQYCGDKESILHVHHLCYSPNKNPWDVDEYALLCLCENCHTVSHLDNLTDFETETLNNVQLIGMTYNGSNKGVNDIVKYVTDSLLKHKSK